MAIDFVHMFFFFFLREKKATAFNGIKKQVITVKVHLINNNYWNVILFVSLKIVIIITATV